MLFVYLLPTFFFLKPLPFFSFCLCYSFSAGFFLLVWSFNLVNWYQKQPSLNSEHVFPTHTRGFSKHSASLLSPISTHEDTSGKGFRVCVKYVGINSSPFRDICFLLVCLPVRKVGWESALVLTPPFFIGLLKQITRTIFGVNPQMRGLLFAKNCI